MQQREFTLTFRGSSRLLAQLTEVLVEEGAANWSVTETGSGVEKSLGRVRAATAPTTTTSRITAASAAPHQRRPRGKPGDRAVDYLRDMLAENPHKTHTTKMASRFLKARGFKPQSAGPALSNLVKEKSAILVEPGRYQTNPSYAPSAED